MTNNPALATRQQHIDAVQDILDGLKREPDADWRIVELRRAVEALGAHGVDWQRDKEKLKELTS